MASTEQHGSLQCSGSEQHFTAVVSHEGYGAGEDGRLVTIDGTLSCPLPEFQLGLERDNPGINPDPEILVLKLVETRPTGTVAQVVTETKVHGEFRIDSRVERVWIRNLDVTVPLVSGSAG
ncbi:hypothetical protein ACIPUC_22745 [Streptomyces sp. LARHCF249]